MTGEISSLFHSLRRDIDRMLCAFGLSHGDVQRTHLGDNDLGGHDEEPDQAPQRELHHCDEEQRDEAPMPRLRPQERDDQGGRRVLPLDSVPLVRLAQPTRRDVEARCLACDEGVSLVNLGVEHQFYRDMDGSMGKPWTHYNLGKWRPL